VMEEFLTKRRRQRLPPAFYRMGGKILYKSIDVEAWIDSTRQEPE